MVDVPSPGVYGLVQPDGELRLWRNRGRDSKRTWPIWNAAAFSVADPVDGRPVWRIAPNVATDAHDHIAEVDLVGSFAIWRPVRFGGVGVALASWVDWLDDLRTQVDTRVWWSSANSRSPSRRALYMPAMPREDLILLVRNLEERSNAGGKEINKAPIGVWIRRMWDVIERRERGDLMGVSP